MNIFLCIDDTDNDDSPGSGQLADILKSELQQWGLASCCSNISRHQLYVHKDIPYTSHNSSMCFTAIISQNKLDDVIEFSRQFLTNASAPGSDPGLCVARDDNSLSRSALIEFGLRAKDTILTKEEAYNLAGKTGIHLSENGGTGDGIVGALAGTGLRLQGNDGRIRGWLELGPTGTITCPKHLCDHPAIDGVVDTQGCTLPEDTPVRFGDCKVKTVLSNHNQVIPVFKTDDPNGPVWSTFTKREMKQF